MEVKDGEQQASKGTWGVARDSFLYVGSNPSAFAAATILTAVPLFFVFSFSISSRALFAEIAGMSSLLADLPQSGIFTEHVREQLRHDVFRLLRLKALSWLPFYVLSVPCTATVVRSAASFVVCHRPNLFPPVRESWSMLVLTSLYVTMIKETYEYLARLAIWLVVSRGGLAAGVWGALWLLRVYLMAVLSIGLVVSVLEERWGLEALAVGWELVEEKRFTGWALGGIQGVLTKGLGWWWWRPGGGGMMLLVGLFSVTVVFSNVLNTAFYFECKRNQESLPKQRESGEASGFI